MPSHLLKASQNGPMNASRILSSRVITLQSSGRGCSRAQLRLFAVGWRAVLRDSMSEAAPILSASLAHDSEESYEAI
jgi:hypothetical protein